MIQIETGKTQHSSADFGHLLATFRQARGLSQGQLAHAARLSRTYVYHLETGQRQAPSPRVARALVRALELHGADRRLFAQEFSGRPGSNSKTRPMSAICWTCVS